MLSCSFPNHPQMTTVIFKLLVHMWWQNFLSTVSFHNFPGILQFNATYVHFISSWTAHFECCQPKEHPKFLMQCFKCPPTYYSLLWTALGPQLDWSCYPRTCMSHSNWRWCCCCWSKWRVRSTRKRTKASHPSCPHAHLYCQQRDHTEVTAIPAWGTNDSVTLVWWKGTSTKMSPWPSSITAIGTEVICWTLQRECIYKVVVPTTQKNPKNTIWVQPEAAHAHAERFRSYLDIITSSSCWIWCWGYRTEFEFRCRILLPTSNMQA